VIHNFEIPDPNLYTPWLLSMRYDVTGENSVYAIVKAVKFAAHALSHDLCVWFPFKIGSQNGGFSEI